MPFSPDEQKIINKIRSEINDLQFIKEAFTTMPPFREAPSSDALYVQDRFDNDASPDSKGLLFTPNSIAFCHKHSEDGWIVFKEISVTYL